MSKVLLHVYLVAAILYLDFSNAVIKNVLRFQSYLIQLSNGALHGMTAYLTSSSQSVILGNTIPLVRLIDRLFVF